MTWRRSAVVLVLVVAAVLAALAAFSWLSHTEHLPAQTSPDGKWRVTVYGKQLWTGAVEVSVRMATPNGGTGPWVKGTASSFEEFRDTYGKLDFRGDQAFAKGQLFVSRPAPR